SAVRACENSRSFACGPNTTAAAGMAGRRSTGVRPSPPSHDSPTHTRSADAWAWQDALASGTSVGAPPDRFVTRGQDWGLPPFVPHRLRALGYGPFIE